MLNKYQAPPIVRQVSAAPKQAHMQQVLDVFQQQKLPCRAGTIGAVVACETRGSLSLKHLAHDACPLTSSPKKTRPIHRAAGSGPGPYRTPAKGPAAALAMSRTPA